MTKRAVQAARFCVRLYHVRQKIHPNIVNTKFSSKFNKK